MSRRAGSLTSTEIGSLPTVRQRKPQRRRPIGRAIVFTYAIAAIVAGCIAHHMHLAHATVPASRRALVAVHKVNVKASPAPSLAPSSPTLLNPRASLRRAWRLAEGRRGSRDILFTFDDGPNPGTTDEVLQILDEAHVHGMFFVVGNRLEGEGNTAARSRELLHEIVARGHTVGNHSMTHARLSLLSNARVAYQIDRTDALIAHEIGEQPRFFRPPYGDYSSRVRAHVRETGHELWMWSIDPQDWAHVDDADSVTEAVTTALARDGGGTIILHDIHPWTPAALRNILAWIDRENHTRAARGEPEFRIVDAQTFADDLRRAGRSS